MPRIIFNEQLKKFETVNDLPEETKEKDKEILPYFDMVKIRKLYGGLPIYTTSTDINPKVGEVYLVASGSSTRLCARFSNITNSVSLTQT